jgi:hypothetical protein
VACGRSPVGFCDFVAQASEPKKLFEGKKMEKRNHFAFSHQSSKEAKLSTNQPIFC